MAKNKNKKQKTRHHQYHPTTNGNSTTSLSHEEIWDDSALIRSWNDAVAEYDFYHSIHARGEDVDEVLRQAERDEEASRAKSRLGTESRRVEAMQESVDGTDGGADSPDEGEIEDDTDGEKMTDEDLATLRKRAENNACVNEDGQLGLDPPVVPDIASTEIIGPPLPPSDPARTNGAPGMAPANAPPSLLAPNQSTESTANTDHTLENIKMAYYWAGYYSGLHDGQRQAQAQTQNQGLSQDQPGHGG